MYEADLDYLHLYIDRPLFRIREQQMLSCNAGT